MRFLTCAVAIWVNLLTLPFCVAEAAEDTLARRSVPDDGRMAITDLGYREWAPELVHYRVDTARFVPGKLVLLDADGKAVPFQIDGNALAFVASAPEGGTARYHLASSARDRAGENTTLASGRDGDAFMMRNKFLALRMPLPGAKTYAEPVEAAKAPPPILQWAHGDHGWMGGARFATKRTIASHTFTIVRNGPACIEYEARYRFSPKGEYVWRVRLSPLMPIAVVTEEFDVGEMTDGHDLLLLDLHKGWTPERT
ncbi:hypothetical protein HQ560_16105, partial [bacterium]|nr:hypothetical protein [bacterium]